MAACCSQTARVILYMTVNAVQECAGWHQADAGAEAGRKAVGMQTKMAETGLDLALALQKGCCRPCGGVACRPARDWHAACRPCHRCNAAWMSASTVAKVLHDCCAALAAPAAASQVVVILKQTSAWGRLMLGMLWFKDQPGWTPLGMYRGSVPRGRAARHSTPATPKERGQAGRRAGGRVSSLP